MDFTCVICEVKPDAELLCDLVQYSTAFYNVTSFEISEREDARLLKICKVCRDKLLQYDVFRTHCIKVWTNLKRVSRCTNNPFVSPTFVKVEDNVNDIHRSDDDWPADAKSDVEDKPESPVDQLLAIEDIDVSRSDASNNDGNDVDAAYRKNTPEDSNTRTSNTSRECHLCGKLFRNQNNLEGHIRVHQGLKPALCTLCGKAFIRWHSLKLHVQQKHTEQRAGKVLRISCDFDGCELSFTTKQGMFRHRKKHDPGYTKPVPTTFVCELCGKTFSSKASLQKHSFIHTGNMPFHCAVCDKRYPTAHKLKEHTMRHEGIKNHTCPQCGLKKTTMHELRVHMNYHTKAKTFPCEFCNKVFMNSGNLATHVKTVHQRLTPFSCTHCSRCFGKKESLKRHLMTHTGERPHACAVCDKRFIQLVALQSHSKIHSK